MRSLPIVRAVVSGLILLTLPTLPAANCAANGGVAHVCCSDLCACSDHPSHAAGGAAAEHVSVEHPVGRHGGHDDHHDGAAATSDTDDLAAGDSCALPADRDDPSPRSAGVNISTLRPVILAASVEITPPTPVRSSATPVRYRVSDRADDVSTPPPRV